jgi:ribosomal protein S18 acetylase RimI-like enzyme
MHIRTANVDDLTRIKTLYKEVAHHEGGIVRLEQEITDAYIENFIEKSLANGLIIVAENPNAADQLIAEVHAYKPGIKTFDHVLSDLTLVVHPAFQGKKIGRTVFTIFLEEIAKERNDIGKVELIARESNRKAIGLYQSLGFSIEGRLEMRIKTSGGSYEADIIMGWQNPNFEF